MLRKLFFSVFLLTTGFYSYSQKNAFSFGGGYSLPIGKFASKALDDPKAGMAGSGYFAQVNYERKLFSGVGLRISASHNLNSTNPEPLIQKANELVDMYRMLIGEYGQYTWTSNAGNWKQSSIMIGPALYIPIGPLTLEAHAQAGRLFIDSPEVSLQGTSSSGNNPIDAVMLPVKTQAWGAGGGISLRIPLGSVVQFKLFAEAIAAEATFKDIALRGTVGGIDASHHIDEKRAVGVVNTGAGFVFRF